MASASRRTGPRLQPRTGFRPCSPAAPGSAGPRAFPEGIAAFIEHQLPSAASARWTRSPTSIAFLVSSRASGSSARATPSTGGRSRSFFRCPPGPRLHSCLGTCAARTALRSWRLLWSDEAVDSASRSLQFLDGPTPGGRGCCTPRGSVYETRGRILPRAPRRAHPLQRVPRTGSSIEAVFAA